MDSGYRLFANFNFSDRLNLLRNLEHNTPPSNLYKLTLTVFSIGIGQNCVWKAIRMHECNDLLQTLDAEP
ncbi:hypothetical protein [Flavobacterium suncheonense]|uniref:hypothetical protein n=1 Tax=Flavobacterium suncheonense TaxID=350894 RepID=UPI003FA3C5C4